MTAFNKILSSLFGAKKGDESSEPDPSPEIVVQYVAAISQYIPYFLTLGQEEKNRFIKRTWIFRHSKRFHFTGMPEDPLAPVLISAAAVQLTFGLRRFRLDFFKDIHILPDAYRYDDKDPPYIGHVSPKGIYISWKHFLQGYADSSDNVNVAIHEMAHAVQYDNFIAQTDADHEFRADFQKLPAVFGPTMANLVVHRRSYLRTYAFQDLQEFWAVSVEAFFENPAGLRDNMPRLYYVIGEILNQDPGKYDTAGKTA